MTTKQLPGVYAKDGATYSTITDGAGSLVTTSTSLIAGSKCPGPRADDGSFYFTLTDGQGTLV